MKDCDIKPLTIECSDTTKGIIKSQISKKFTADYYLVIFELDNGHKISSLTKNKFKDYTGRFAIFTTSTIEIR